MTARAPNGYIKRRPDGTSKEGKQRYKRVWIEGPPKNNTLSMRATRFRDKAACLSWVIKDGSAARNARILALIPAEFKHPLVNSTKGWRNLTKDEIQKIKEGATKSPNKVRKANRAAQADNGNAVEAEELQEDLTFAEAEEIQDQDEISVSIPKTCNLGLARKNIPPTLSEESPITPNIKTRKRRAEKDNHAPTSKGTKNTASAATAPEKGEVSRLPSLKRPIRQQQQNQKRQQAPKSTARPSLVQRNLYPTAGLRLSSRNPGQNDHPVLSSSNFDDTPPSFSQSYDQALSTTSNAAYDGNTLFNSHDQDLSFMPDNSWQQWAPTGHQPPATFQSNQPSNRSFSQLPQNGSSYAGNHSYQPNPSFCAPTNPSLNLNGYSNHQSAPMNLSPFVTSQHDPIQKVKPLIHPSVQKHRFQQPRSSHKRTLDPNNAESEIHRPVKRSRTIAANHLAAATAAELAPSLQPTNSLPRESFLNPNAQLQAPAPEWLYGQVEPLNARFQPPLSEPGLSYPYPKESSNSKDYWSGQNVALENQQYSFLPAPNDNTMKHRPYVNLNEFSQDTIPFYPMENSNDPAKIYISNPLQPNPSIPANTFPPNPHPFPSYPIENFTEPNYTNRQLSGISESYTGPQSTNQELYDNTSYPYNSNEALNFLPSDIPWEGFPEMNPGWITVGEGGSGHGGQNFQARTAAGAGTMVDLNGMTQGMGY